MRRKFSNEQVQRVKLQRWPVLLASGTTSRFLHGHKHGPPHTASELLKERMKITIRIISVSHREPISK